jgi:hypothetical protein
MPTAVLSAEYSEANMKLLATSVLVVVLAVASAGSAPAARLVVDAPTMTAEVTTAQAVRYPTARAPKRARKSTRWARAQRSSSEHAAFTLTESSGALKAHFRSM